MLISLRNQSLKFLLTLTLMCEACHRTGKKDTRIGSTKTIIRVVNMKHAKQALYNKKKLSQVKKKNTRLTLTIIPFLLART